MAAAKEVLPLAAGVGAISKLATAKAAAAKASPPAKARGTAEAKAKPHAGPKAQPVRRARELSMTPRCIKSRAYHHAYDGALLAEKTPEEAKALAREAYRSAAAGL